MLKQLHIFDTKALHLQLYIIYLPNTLVNLCGLPPTFYKVDFFLKY